MITSLFTHALKFLSHAGLQVAANLMGLALSRQVGIALQSYGVSRITASGCSCGRLLRTLGHSDNVFALDITSDSQKVVTVSADKVELRLKLVQMMPKKL